jgi:hypothetical protein
VPEQFMGLRGEGDLLTRVFTVRRKGWDYLFQGDQRSPDQSSPDRISADQSSPDLQSPDLRSPELRQRERAGSRTGRHRPRQGVADLERVLANRVADEAYLQLRHNELVDVLEYVRTDYIGPQASRNRLIEYALNLADVVNRLMGGDISTRYSPPGKQVEVRIGEPLELGALGAALPGGQRRKAEGVMNALRESFDFLCRESL